MEQIAYMFTTVNGTDMDIAYAVTIAYSAVSDTLGVIGLLSLIIYKLREKLNESESKRNHHGPIFDQLLYVSTFVVFIQVFTRFLSLCRSLADEHSLFSFLFMFSASVVYFYSTVISVILMFSFLAAFQKLIILYQPDYKWCVTGVLLNIEIGSVWALNAHYFYLTLFRRIPSSGLLCSAEMDPLVLVYQLAFLTCTYSSVCIYFKIYKLVAKFTQPSHQHKNHFLSQFLPIHLFLTIHTTVSLGCTISEWFSSECTVVSGDMYIALFSFPMIPTLVSFSYIASRQAVRKTVRALMTQVHRALRETVN